MQKAGQFRLTHVTYRGTRSRSTTCCPGKSDFIIATTISVMPHLQAGKVQPIVTADQKRSSVLPDVPTLEESGYPGFDVESVAGLVAPAGTPAAIIARLNQEIQMAGQEAELREELIMLGYDVAVGTTDDFRRKIDADAQKYEKLIPELGLAGN